MKKTKLHKIIETLSISNMTEFCIDNKLSIRSYEAKKARELLKGNKIFYWKGYIIDLA